MPWWLQDPMAAATIVTLALCVVIAVLAIITLGEPLD